MPRIRRTEVIKKTVYIVGTFILPTSEGARDGEPAKLYNNNNKKTEVTIFNLGYFFHVTVMFEGSSES